MKMCSYAKFVAKAQKCGHRATHRCNVKDCHLNRHAVEISTTRTGCKLFRKGTSGRLFWTR